MASAADAPAMPIHRETPWSLAVAGVVMVVFLVAAPFVLYPVFLMKALCFALFACAFNLLIGYVGLVSFGHALYFGWASYLAAYAAKSWGLQPELAVLIGTATGAGLGVIAGVIAIRRQGIYFAMITLALAQMMYLVALAREIHRRRGWHPGGAARAPVRRVRSQRRNERCTCSFSSSRWPRSS